MLPKLEFELFNQIIVLKTYNVFMFLSIFVGLLITFKTLKQYGLNSKTILSLYLSITISFLIGARLLNYILQYKLYKSLGISLLTLKLSYFSLYGGIILAFIVLLFIIKSLKLNSFSILDKITIPFLISFFIMKIGCFLNGCCYGKTTKSWFSIPLPVKQQSSISNSLFAKFIFGNISIRVYPTQFMEEFGALFILIFLIIIRKKLAKGKTFLIAAALFSALRLIVLFYRELPYSNFILIYFYPILYISIIIGSIIILFKIKIKKLKSH